MSYLPITQYQYDQLTQLGWDIIGEIQDNFPCTNEDDGEAVDPHLRRVQELAGILLDILGSVEQQDAHVVGGYDVDYPVRGVYPTRGGETA